MTRLTEPITLAQLRAARNRTQAEIADAIGTSQSGVSRIERQSDLLLSTLSDYVRATGGRLRLSARYAEDEYEIRLPTLDQPNNQPRRFRVVWQNVNTRKLVHVGSLSFDGARFVFNYTANAELDTDFEPFPDFPEFRGTYGSDRLFPFFRNRSLLTARSDHGDLLAALGLTRDEATPVELLARTWGASPHDTLQIIPDPVERDDGTEIVTFLVSGVRHADESNPERVGQRIASLREGQQLNLRDDPDNPSNPQAIILEVEGEPVGWIPDHLLEYVHKSRENSRNLSVFVEHANGPETMWHLRLLCRLEVA